MGQQYDELNITASDYTIFMDISARHRDEFKHMFERELELEKNLGD